MHALVSAPAEAVAETGLSAGRIEARGKFFFANGEKLYLKGVTYGPFPVGSHGASFPEASAVTRDFSLMRELGANCIRTFTAPPPWLLDAAADRGLGVLMGISWAQHLCFLESAASRADIRREIKSVAERSRRHPAVAAYLVGNEIPPDIVRWYGPRRVERFLADLAAVARDADPGALIAYANFPSTEYLGADFADFLAFNVYLHEEPAFRRYLGRLQVLADDRPLVLTELGIDSIREGRAAQARMLEWQLRAAFEVGAAGAVVFSWTDEWFTGGEDLRDWAFGLVDRDRRPKPAFAAVRQRYIDPAPRATEPPLVSVVVCAYNADSTLDGCLVSLAALSYPSYEVIVVNDGSTDSTAAIMARHRFIRPIHFEANRGLSAARNAGLAAARGEIVAYTDADCLADPHWLDYLVATFQSTDMPAAGGPNLPPPEASLVASCVAVSPGGPQHVLIDDQEAEHVPGCNMAFRREVLREIGGFDPIYRAAGDDVDVCWRLQDRGHRIAFSPAAMVWHHRRNTVGAYLRQQRGYGKAEGLLYLRHPHRFNRLGHSRWRGRIYGGLASLLSLRRPVVYAGVYGRGLFQTLYQPPSGLAGFLPLTIEWNAVALLFLAWALARGGIAWLGALPLALSVGLCLNAALRARLDPRSDSLQGRLLVALLTYLAPLARGFERYRWLVRGLTDGERVKSPRPFQRLPLSWRTLDLSVSYWTETGVEKESILERVRDAMTARRYVVVPDRGWSHWDLEVHGGIWTVARIRACGENHGGDRRVLRVRCALRPSVATALSLGAYVAIAGGALLVGMPALAVAGAVGVIGVIALAGLEASSLARSVYEVVNRAARQVRLHYVPRRRAAAQEPAQP
jgi:O-antigen biosynthesis protein